MAPPDPVTIAAENARRADDVIDALVAHGVGDVFVAPGSRSTPLVLALVRRRLRTHVLLDERAAGFCAVGAARLGQRAAIVTTSGTAVANLLPAVAEAERDGLPLVCCTADRGVDDVERGASQTLRQPPLLAGVARAVIDLPAPRGPDDPQIGPLLDDALARLDGPDAGPVHLNVRFDKPLEPPPGWTSQAPAAATHVSARRPIDLDLTLPAGGVVVVGALPIAARAAVRRALETLGWPVVADVTSGLGPLSASVPRLPTVALRVTAVRAALRPRAVLWIGGLLVEDAVAAWLQGLRRDGAVPVVQLACTTTRRDPFGLFDRTIVVDAARLDDGGLDSAVARLPAGDDTLAAAVRALAAAVAPVIDGVADGALTEPAVARVVSTSLSSGEVLLLGNSMPVRDVDRFGAVTAGVDVIANRGAAGIDGCIATALGACLVSGRPTTALLGDLAVLHDLSSLAALAHSGAPVRVVVVNNGGGGIFSFLPVSGAIDEDSLRRFFETPHAFALAPVARALGLETVVAKDTAALRAALRSPPTRPTLVEVQTRRDDNVAVHRALDRAIDLALDLAIDLAAAAAAALAWRAAGAP